MNTLYVLCGMVCSGKTSYANRIAKEGVICINDDRIVEMVHGGNYSLYRKELKPLYKSIENHIFGAAIQIGKSVLIDRGLNCSPAGRARWLALAKSFDIPAVAIVFPRERALVHAERRFQSDPRGLPLEHWIKAAERHEKEWVDPTLEEGFAEISRA
ncbi:MAG: AAA family ATPase [Nitrososphaerales archaeon]